MPNITYTKKPNKVELATGLNIFSLYNTLNDTPRQVLKLTNYNGNSISELRQLPNLTNTTHYDVGKLLSYNLSFSPNLESIKKLGTAQYEAVLYKADMGYISDLSPAGLTAVPASTNTTGTIGYNPYYLALNGRKDSNIIDWDYEEYGNYWFNNSGTAEYVKIIKPLTDKKFEPISSTTLAAEYIDCKENLTLSFLNLPSVKGLNDINRVASISSFSIQFIDENNLVLYTENIVNNPSNGGGPLINYNDPEYIDIRDYGAEFGVISIQVAPEFYPVNSDLVKKANLKIYTGVQNIGVSPQQSNFDIIFIDSNCSPFKKVPFSWVNSFGFRDYYTFNQKHEKIYNKSNEEYSTVIGDRSGLIFSTEDKRSSISINNTFDISYTTTSDWLTDEESKYLTNLLLSPFVKFKDPDDGEWKPIIITNKNWTEKNYRNDRLFQLTIEYKLAYKNNLQNG